MTEDQYLQMQLLRRAEAAREDLMIPEIGEMLSPEEIDILIARLETYLELDT